MWKKKTSPKSETKPGKESGGSSGKSSRKGHYFRGLLIRGGIVLILIAGLTYTLQNQGVFSDNIDPLELADAAIANTFAAETYHFKSRATLFINSEQRVFSVLAGEKSGADRHVQGSILGTPVNIYHVAESFYQQDPVNGQWHQVAESNLQSAAVLMTELDPQKNFHFSSLGTAEDLGKTQVEGVKTRRIQVFPVLEDKWIERYFQDITYDLYISLQREPKIIQAIISGVSKENTAGTLVIENYFYDYGKELLIKAPITP